MYLSIPNTCTVVAYGATGASARIRVADVMYVCVCVRVSDR